MCEWLGVERIHQTLQRDNNAQQPIPANKKEQVKFSSRRAHECFAANQHRQTFEHSGPIPKFTRSLTFFSDSNVRPLYTKISITD